MDTTPELLKPKATIEDLLGLPKEGWEAIAKMDEEQLANYLGDITNLEPKIPSDAQWRGVKEPKVKKTKTDDSDEQNELELVDENPGSDNPIKQNKPKKKKLKSVFSQEEIDNLLEDL